MKRVALLTIFVFFLGFTQISCSNAPSDSLVENDVNSTLKSDWPGQFKMVSFKRLNGEGGESYYEVKFTADLKALKDTNGVSARGYHIQYLTGKWIKHQKPIPKPKYPYHDAVLKDIKAGDIYRINDNVIYKKTERGWRVKEGLYKKRG